MQAPVAVTRSVDKVVSISRTDAGGTGTSEGTVGSRAASSPVRITVRTQVMVAVSALARKAPLLGASSEKDTQTVTEPQGTHLPHLSMSHKRAARLAGFKRKHSAAEGLSEGLLWKVSQQY